MKRYSSRHIPDTRSLFKRIIALLLGGMIILSFGTCRREKDIRDVILKDKKSFYFIDVNSYPSEDDSLPVGIFDSGTGGLSVLNDILNYKYFAEPANEPGEQNVDPYPLRNESYIFLADMANMPYGSYSLENNTGLLIEHIFKNVQFMLGNKYYRTADSPSFQTDKSPVKAIVIACNTATAYGLDTVKNFLETAGLDIFVIGVIDAAAWGAFANFSPDENGSIAILATDATVKSGAYIRAMENVKLSLGQTGDVQIYQRPGIGIAEAVDENIDFIDRLAKAPRKEYKGPSDTGKGDLLIDLSLLRRYNFDMENRAMLFEGSRDNPVNMQINSVENYISFHLVSLLEKIKSTPGARPLNSIVLACTHYPFFEDEFRSTIQRLRDYSEDGEFVYRHLIAEDFIVINPAAKVAEELYKHLNERNLTNKSGQTNTEFYISVPNLNNKDIKLREDGTFTYEYKYGRNPGNISEYVKCVPFSRTTVSRDILSRLSYQVPAVFELIEIFNHDNSKTDFLKQEEKIMNQ